MRTSTLQAAYERLKMVASVFAQPPAAHPSWRAISLGVAGNPEIIAVARSKGRRVSDSARALLANITPDTGFTLAADIRDRDGTVVFSLASSIADSLTQSGALDEPGQRKPVAEDSIARIRLSRSYPDTIAWSELYRRGSLALVERATPIMSDGAVIGHLVEVRRVSTATNAVRQLENLIGREAALVVGNPDGSVWSDLPDPIEHPPPSSEPQTYSRNGRRWLSVTTPIPQGPWILGIEFPEDIVLARVHALRWRLFAIGAVLVTLAVIIIERLSRRLTLPLQSLTTAAERIAGGDRNTPVNPLERRDEIGRLSRAFAAMSVSIRASHDTLEHEIDQRTRELQAALTRLQEAQDELVRRERLATVGQLSGSIAHELRNPLGVMTNALFYLEHVLGPEGSEKVREHIAKLRKQVRLSESIINGLLNITRTGEPRLEAVALAPVVEEQLDRAGVPPNIRVERDIPADLPDISADPVHLGQIIMNLFTNAIQAMEGSEGVLSVSACAAGDRVRIEVGDTGPGIQAGDRERIFEPLFTTKARGIGLGLSVSRSLAVANHGTLAAVAKPGGAGALLVLEVPVAAPASATAVLERSATAHV